MCLCTKALNRELCVSVVGDLTWRTRYPRPNDYYSIQQEEYGYPHLPARLHGFFRSVRL